MDYTLIEIKNHKNKISELSAKLNNNIDINDEIILSNELKKEAEFLISLLNIKKNEINQKNNFNNNFQQMLQQQMFQQQMIAQQQMMNAQFQTLQNQVQMNNIKIENINVKFNKNGKIISIKMSNNCMVAELIDEYYQKTKTRSGTFKYNNEILKDYDTAALYEVGLQNNSEIIVN